MVDAHLIVACRLVSAFVVYPFDQAPQNGCDCACLKHLSLCRVEQSIYAAENR